MPRPISQRQVEVREAFESYLTLHETQAKRRELTRTLAGFSQTLGYVNKPFHNAWYEIFETQRLFLLKAPRGHAKTTCGTVVRSLYEILRNPDIRILIVSGVIADARRIVGEILTNIEQRWPQLKRSSKKWSETEAFVARTSASKDPTLRATGILGVKPGPRADIILLDDVVNEDNASSQLLREKVVMKIRKVVIPMLEPGGQMGIIGTPWHYGDTYALFENEGWPTFSYQAESHPNHPDNQALWPERWPLDCGQRDPETGLHPGLCCLQWAKEALGTPIYNCQYLCDPSGLVGRMLHQSWLEPFYNSPGEPPLPGDMDRVMGVDLAFTEKTSADYTACVTVGYSAQTNTMYVLDVYREQARFPEQLGLISQRYEVMKPNRIIVESNAFQNMLVIKPLQAETMLPIIPRETIKDIVTRMLQISPYFETKRLRIRNDMHPFISEYLQFPEGEHDDMLSALHLAVTDIIGRHLSAEGQWKGTGGVLRQRREWWQNPPTSGGL